MRISDIIKVPEIEQLFPRPYNYADIKADIEDRGIQEAIVVNEAGQLLCGYTRLAIAEELGIEEIAHRTVDVTGTAAMMEYAILDNIRRRQLTDLQLVEYGIKLEEVYGERQGQRTDLWTECPQVETGLTRDIVTGKIEDETGVRMSGRKYDRLKTIAVSAAPEVKEKFNQGELSQSAVLEMCRLGKAEQIKALKKACSRSTKAVEDIVSAREREIGEAYAITEIREGYFQKHPEWDQYRADIELGDLEFQSANAKDFIYVKSITKKYEWQEKHWPRYSGQRRISESGEQAWSEAAMKYPVFLEDEWRGISLYTSESQDILSIMFPDFLVFPDSEFVCENAVMRRTYDHDYGHFTCSQKEICGENFVSDGYIRGGCGMWEIVEFNDGDGGRERRRYFDQDYYMSTLLELAIETADPDCFSHWDYHQLALWDVQKTYMCWSHIRKETVKRADVISALETDLNRLKNSEVLSQEEIEKRAMDLLDEYFVLVRHPSDFREGRATCKRLRNGEIDVDFMEELYNRTHGGDHSRTQEVKQRFLKFLKDRSSTDPEIEETAYIPIGEMLRRSKDLADESQSQEQAKC